VFVSVQLIRGQGKIERHLPLCPEWREARELAD
jgi:hypothetical protein